jgi:hypothetical protein
VSILEFVNHIANCVILGFVSHVEKLCHFRVCFSPFFLIYLLIMLENCVNFRVC